MFVPSNVIIHEISDNKAKIIMMKTHLYYIVMCQSSKILPQKQNFQLENVKNGIYKKISRSFQKYLQPTANSSKRTNKICLKRGKMC